jgi:hypothetical protein
MAKLIVVVAVVAAAVAAASALPTPAPTTLSPTAWTPTVSPVSGGFPGLKICTQDREYDYTAGPAPYLCRPDGSEKFTRDDDGCPDDSNQGWVPCPCLSFSFFNSNKCCCTCGTQWSLQGTCPKLPDGCFPCTKSGFLKVTYTVLKPGGCDPATTSNCYTCDSKGNYLAKTCPITTKF